MQVDAFDEDGDGKIDAEELAKQTGITVERAREVISKIDADEDGKIDPEEFEKLKQRLIDEHEARLSGHVTKQTSILTPEEVDTLGQRVYAMSTHHIMDVDGMSRDELDKLKEDVDGILDLLQTVLGQTTAGRKALKDHENQKVRTKRIGRADDVAGRRSTISHASRTSQSNRESHDASHSP